MAEEQRCPVCGVEHTACGGPTSTIPVDDRREEPSVGPLREYLVVVNGHNTVMNLDEVDAERLAGTPVLDNDNPDPANGGKTRSRGKRGETPPTGGDSGTAAAPDKPGSPGPVGTPPS